MTQSSAKYHLILAPIRGVTDAVYRTVFTETFGGFESAVAPFVRVEKGVVRANALSDLLPEHNRQLKLVPQILSKSPTDFVAAAKQLAQQGYSEVNWNLGCPHAGVVKRGLGAGLLAHPETIDRFLDTVLPRLELKISVKSRLGVEDPCQLLALLPVLNQYPLDQIIIHPRTAKEMYGGTVHLNRFAECLKTAIAPVVYNGDIRHPDDLTQLQERFAPVTQWMIGRGAIENPLLPQQLNGGSATLAPNQLRKFHDTLYTRYQTRLSGPSHLIAKMQGIWSYLAVQLRQPHKFQKLLKKTNTLKRYEQLLDEYLPAVAK